MLEDRVPAGKLGKIDFSRVWRGAESEETHRQADAQKRQAQNRASKATRGSARGSAREGEATETDPHREIGTGSSGETGTGSNREMVEKHEQAQAGTLDKQWNYWEEPQGSLLVCG